MRFTFIKFSLLVVVIAVSDLSAQSSTFQGKVINAEQQPVSGVQVIAVAGGTRGARDVFKGVSNDDGVYEMTLPTDTAHVVLLAQKKGYGLSAGRGIIHKADVQAMFNGTYKEPIVLAKAKPIQVQIVAPDGKPVKARLVLTSISNSENSRYFYVYLSDSMKGKLPEWTTDDEGKLLFHAQPADDMVGLAAVTAEYGTQPIMLSHQQMTESVTWKLNPMAKVVVSLEGTDKKAGRRVTIDTRTKAPNATGIVKRKELSPGYSQADAVTDENGVATMDVMAGQASIYMTPEAGDRDFSPANNNQVSIEPDSTMEHTLRLVPGLKLSGRIVDPDENPVRGVVVVGGMAKATTDKEGRYNIHVPPDRPWMRIESAPDGYMVANEHLHHRIDSTKPEQQLPDSFVEVARAVTGSVVNEQQEPVVDAKVKASWVQHSRTDQTFSLRSDSVATDGEGRFRLSRIASGNRLRVTVELDGMAAAPRMLAADGEEPLELVVSVKHVAKVRGIIVDGAGKPVENAKIKIKRSLQSGDGNNVWGERSIRFDGEQSFKANDNGEFETPDSLPRYGKYSLTFEAPKYADGADHDLAAERLDCHARAVSSPQGT
ncbi:MAG: carboxypeptidase-like regulatory domain-containing protein, partial [Planctomycetota bacterium]